MERALAVGDVVKYVCPEYEHNALVFQVEPEIVLVHVVMVNGRTMPQYEINVSSEPGVAGRYYENAA